MFECQKLTDTVIIFKVTLRRSNKNTHTHAHLTHKVLCISAYVIKIKTPKKKTDHQQQSDWVTDWDTDGPCSSPVSVERPQLREPTNERMHQTLRKQRSGKGKIDNETTSVRESLQILYAALLESLAILISVHNTSVWLCCFVLFIFFFCAYCFVLRIFICFEYVL